MIFFKLTFIFLITLVLVFLQISCVPISDYKEVIGYLENFGYLSNDEKASLNHNIDNHEGIKRDSRFKRALKDLQRNGNIPITGKLDKNTATLMETPRCGVSDKNLIGKRHKRYTLMSSKWPSPNLSYRFDHKGNQRFIENEEDIRRIIREAFNVWEKDTIMKFTEKKEGDVDIYITFVKPKHLEVDPYVFGSNTLAHAFQPGKGLGGDAHFNELINWDFKVSFASNPEDGKISFFGVALHELGHSLGLGHTRVEDAVMYEFYSRTTSTLAEDDIRGLQHIYGVPANKKYTPPPKLEDSEESMPVWGQTPVKPKLPDRCYSTYDAIALIDDELIAFRGKYMFGPKLNMTEFRSRWKDFSPKTTHVDAVFQTYDKKVLFFMNQDVYSFAGDKGSEKSYKLKDLGIEEDALKIDSIFRKSDNNQIYIFVKNNYYIFDEHKMKVTKESARRITEAFKDVYDLDTAFTFTDGITYFFKNESYYEFNNTKMRLNRMKPGLSANKFMNCDVPPVIDIAQRFNFGEDEHTTGIIDYIDGFLGVEEHEEQNECNPESIKPCRDDKGSANSIKSFSILAAVLIVSHIFI